MKEDREQPFVMRCCPDQAGQARICLLADTHGMEHAMRRVLGAAGAVDLCIHLGDYARDVPVIRNMMPKWNVVQVRGNNDAGFSAPEELIIDVAGTRLYATHGHIFGAGMRHERLYYRAQELGAGVALFGHTHRSLLQKQNGVLLINPGSAGLPRDGQGCSYAVLEIVSGKVRADIFKI